MGVPSAAAFGQMTDMAVTDEIDIYRSAKLYIDNHGDQAALQAAMRSDALLEAGDLDGVATWRKTKQVGRG